MPARPAWGEIFAVRKDPRTSGTPCRLPRQEATFDVIRCAVDVSPSDAPFSSGKMSVPVGQADRGRNHGDTALRNLSTKVAKDDRELHQWQTHDGREVFGVDPVEQ